MLRAYRVAAALNLTISSAGTRPRSFTSMPCALAHSRTSVVFRPSADALRPPRAGRRQPPPAPPGRQPVARKRLPQRLGMLGVQVDLVIRAVQAEADRALSFAAVEVV